MTEKNGNENVTNEEIKRAIDETKKIAEEMKRRFTGE